MSNFEALIGLNSLFRKIREYSLRMQVESVKSVKKTRGAGGEERGFISLQVRDMSHWEAEDEVYHPSSFPPSEDDAALQFRAPLTPSELPFAMDEDQEMMLPETKFSSEVTVFIDFLQAHTCFEMVPASGKIVVLDVSLEIKVAFQALIENRIKSAPLWDSEEGDYVGMITVTDFIDIVRHFYHTQQSAEAPVPMKQEDYQIKHWREILSQKGPTSLVSVHPDDTIFDASHILIANHIHRVPIIDQLENNTMLHILSHHRILVFLLSNVQGVGRDRLLSRTIEELEVGTFNNVVTMLADTPLIVALNLLAERQISSVPLVDETGVVEAVYSKSDAAGLAKHPDIFSQLDKPVQQFTEKVSVYPDLKGKEARNINDDLASEEGVYMPAEGHLTKGPGGNHAGVQCQACCLCRLYLASCGNNFTE